MSSIVFIFVFCFLILLALSMYPKVKKREKLKKLMLVADLIFLLAVLIWALAKLKEKSILTWP